MTATTTTPTSTHDCEPECASTTTTTTGDDNDGTEMTTTTDGDAVAAGSTSTTSNSSDNNDNTNNSTALKVLFLSSDTGGGHRASAESLGRQFQLLFPGTTYDLLDVVEKDGVPPYNSLVSYYKHLSSHPAQWKLVYSVSNSRAFEMLADAHLKLMCERAVRKSIKSYDPDVVVSVHPLMTNVPVLSCSKISNETGRNLPIFTVVTDLGAAHCLWFANGVEKMFVGSRKIMELAKSRGKVPEEKLVLAGLPIRHDFAIQAEQMGDRMSAEGKEYQKKVRIVLGLPYNDRKTILVMGGGEGVGSLSNIVDSLYVELVSQGIDALVLVVCGRNEKLKDSLDERNWVDVFKRYLAARERHDGGSMGTLVGRSSASAKTRIMSMRDACVSGIPGTNTTIGCIETGSTAVSSVIPGSIRRILTSTTGKFVPKKYTVGNVMSTPLPEVDNNQDVDNIIPVQQHEPGQPMTARVTDEDNNSNSDIAHSNSLLDDGTTSPVPAMDETTGSAADVGTLVEDDDDDDNRVVVEGTAGTNDSIILERQSLGNVRVVGLGFVNRMAEYMVAADVLVSKAGPGTIMEAAALSLPVMLTSFLPGQEEGNVNYVLEGGFGSYVRDSDPIGIAEEVCMWLTDDSRLHELSNAAKRHGTPYAARDIARMIGNSTLKWKELNESAAAGSSLDASSSSAMVHNDENRGPTPPPPPHPEQDEVDDA